MMNKDVKEMLSELKKIRGDQDKLQAYVKTIAENTPPTPEPEPEPEPGN